MAVPNIFGTATAAIPLSQLDQNFATAITLGNTAVYLGNTTTSLGNVTLTNVTISSGTSNIAANVSTAVGLLPESAGGTGTTTGYYGFKSRIINGGMVIDQRNAGAVVTPTTSTDGYPVDRFVVAVTQNSKLTTQQNAGGLTGTNLPVGFQNYLGVTSSSAYSVVAADVFAIYHRIEGFNFADMQWGTTNAKTITLSFQVYSSLTGTFGGALRNAASNRSYPFTYTVGSANTWTSISITVAGDTTGTWVGATNGIGLQIWFGLGVGSTASGTAGAWAAANYTSATGATSVVGTNGATFYITGVQLEKGSTATSFDYRPIGTELQLCQRYFEKTDTTNSLPFIAQAYSSTKAQAPITWKVTKRAAPTIAFSGGAAVYLANGTGSGATYTFSGINPDSAFSEATTTGLVAGNASLFYTTGTSAFTFSAEL